MKRLIFLWLLAVLWPLDRAPAQFIRMRISVKHILDQNGQPPAAGSTWSDWMDTNQWRASIDIANAANARFVRGFRYEYPVFEGGISGASQYFNLVNGSTPAQPGDDVLFEYDARTNPQQYLWRQNAFNIYVVNENFGCAGWASSPNDPLWRYGPPYSTMTGRMSVFCVGTGPPLAVPAHEFGHHMGLIHPWVEDRVADTPVDADPYQCLPEDPNTSIEESCINGGTSGCCYDTQRLNTLALAAADNWGPYVTHYMLENLMSYHAETNAVELSEGQLDFWTDTARRHLAAECTGVGMFVDVNNPQTTGNDGYSTNAFRTLHAGHQAANPAGGDILYLRPGNFDERLTLNKPVTLRATRAGWATIGRP